MPTWSVAGVLEAEDRTKFDRHLREKTNNCPEATSPDTIFEFAVDSVSFEWTHCEDEGYSADLLARNGAPDGNERFRQPALDGFERRRRRA